MAVAPCNGPRARTRRLPIVSRALARRDLSCRWGRSLSQTNARSGRHDPAVPCSVLLRHANLLYSESFLLVLLAPITEDNIVSRTTLALAINVAPERRVASLTNSVGHTARIRWAVRGPATEYACPVPLHLDAWGHNVSPDPALRSLGIRSLASPWTAKLGRREADVLCVGISQGRQRGTGASHSPRQRRLTFLWDALSMLPFEAPRSTWRWIAFDRCTDERNGSSIAESCDPLTGTSRCDVASGMSCSLFHLI